MTVCPICLADPCPSWERQKTQTWHPLPATPPGVLQPCGENTSGTVLEFFANPADIPDILTNGITATIDGVKVRYSVRLSSTPCYPNGDVQVQAMQQ